MIETCQLLEAPHLLQRRWMGTEPLLGTCFKYANASPWGRETASHLNCCQDPVQPEDNQDTGKLTSPLYLDKSNSTGNVSGLLSLTAADQCRPITSASNDHGGTWGGYLGSQ